MAYIFQKFLYRKSRDPSETFERYHHKIGSGYSFLIQNFKYCRVSGYAEHLIRNMEKESRESQIHFDQKQNKMATQRILMDTIAFFAISCTLGVVYFMGPISFSQASLFLAVIYRLTPKALHALVTYQNAKMLHPFLEKWIEIYNISELNQIFAQPNKMESFHQAIKLNSVSFEYPNSSKPILANINLTFPKNAFVAIIGQSGSGKSTVLDLLTGLSTPTKGSIELDGQDIRTFTDWQRRIGIVQQEPTLIKGTFLQNIAFMDENPDVVWALACAKLANAAEMIEKSKDGIDTVLEAENSLSGGEKQRICLARALYTKPEILILDEPTSALDETNENKFIECLKALKGTVTIIMTTHRPSTIAMADKVVKIQDAEVYEIAYKGSRVQLDKSIA